MIPITVTFIFHNFLNLWSGHNISRVYCSFFIQSLVSAGTVKFISGHLHLPLGSGLLDGIGRSVFISMSLRFG